MGAIEATESERDVLLSEKRTAEFLGVSRRTLQGWRLARSGPKFVKVSSRSIRYRRKDLLAWVETHTIGPHSPSDLPQNDR